MVVDQEKKSGCVVDVDVWMVMMCQRFYGHNRQQSSEEHRAHNLLNEEGGMSEKRERKAQTAQWRQAPKVSEWLAHSGLDTKIKLITKLT